MPIDCTKCQICGVYRKKVIWEFAGGKSKFAHAFFETLKKFFLEAPRRKPPTCGTKTFFLSLLIRLRLSMAVFRISISVIVFVLLKVRINAPKKYPRINAPPYAIFIFKTPVITKRQTFMLSKIQAYLCWNRIKSHLVDDILSTSLVVQNWE